MGMRGVFVSLHVTWIYNVIERSMYVTWFSVFSFLADGSPQSPFRQILPKCKLARDLKEAYDRFVKTPYKIMYLWIVSLFLQCRCNNRVCVVLSSLCTTGVVRLHINNWLEVSFCLPHKIHRVGSNHVPPEALERSLKAIRCELLNTVCDVWVTSCNWR